MSAAEAWPVADDSSWAAQASRVAEAREAVLGALPALEQAGEVWREARGVAMSSFGRDRGEAFDDFLSDLGGLRDEMESAAARLWR